MALEREQGGTSAAHVFFVRGEGLIDGPSGWIGY